jgi:hypothetical protein
MFIPISVVRATPQKRRAAQSIFGRSGKFRCKERES